MTEHCLALRLAGPVQSWGSRSRFNRRETDTEPTKSGIVGLLAAAQGRRRTDKIEDLLGLSLGVRTDRAGTLLRDYHTVSDHRGRSLLAAAVSSKGVQRPTSPAKAVHLTTRFYLQDAVFVAAVGGPASLLSALRDALLRPAFPLALGRRSCVPTMPIVLEPLTGELWPGDPMAVLGAVPWYGGTNGQPAPARLPVVVDDPNGDDVRTDVPTSFDPLARSFRTRAVRHDWVRLSDDPNGGHDPFALLGW